ncbi:MAG: AMP-binding protein [Rothia sp. (in: high G+C Gram-positive bacteria)]|nr:AMP-binding protein [Rothia sp. (in: high G+C Gram-positive bacteria)]
MAEQLASPANSIASLLADRAVNDSPAVSWAGGSLTYRQLVARVAVASRWLTARGVGQGSRVALALPNVPQMVSLYYAALAVGAVAVPLHPLLSAREVQHQVQDAGARLTVVWAGTRVAGELGDLDLTAINGGNSAVEVIDSALSFESQTEADLSIVPVAADDPAVLLYTSGTTGKPKGATLTHANMLSNARTCAEVFGFKTQDVIFGGLPLFHAFGQTVSMNAVFAAGASIALLPRFTPGGAAQLCAVTGVTVFAAVPSMYSALAVYCETDPVLAQQLRGKVRFGISGGAALPASVHADIDRLVGFPVYEGYGLSETAPVVSFNRAEFGLVMGSVGRVLPGVKVQVRDEVGQVLPVGQPGQLWVSGPNVMAGYWGNQQASRAVFDGRWFATGDVARLDDQGNIFIVDRLKDMILRNGNSVYPREIEDVLYTHPQVEAAAVVGRPSDSVGEEIVAVIVPRQVEELGQDATAQLVEQLDELCRQQLAAYKYPRQFVVRKALPLGATGKILKRELAQTL